MLSKTRSMPVYSAAPGVIPDAIMEPVSNGPLVTTRSPSERWLDQGGSFSSEAVTKWLAPR